MASLTAATTFHAQGRTIVAGAEVDASDPIVKGRESLFHPPEVVAASEPKKAPVKKAPARKRPAKKSSGA